MLERLFMLVLTLIAAVAAIAAGFIAARIAAGFARDLRFAVFERVESFSAGEFDKFSTASLITRSTNDIMQIQMVSASLFYSLGNRLFDFTRVAQYHKG